MLVCLQLRALSETPYATQGARIDVEGQKQQHRSGASLPDAPSAHKAAHNEIGDDVCGSLDKWLHPMPSSVDLEVHIPLPLSSLFHLRFFHFFFLICVLIVFYVLEQIPEHLQHIYEKHKNLYAVEMKNTLNSVGKVLQSIFCKRMGELLVEVHSSKSSNKEDGGGGDVTFAVGGSNAAAAPDTSTSVQQAELDSQVAAGPKTPAVQGAGDNALKQGQSCSHVGKGFVDLEKEGEQDDV